MNPQVWLAVVGLGIAGAALLLKVLWRRDDTRRARKEARKARADLRVEIYEKARTGKLRGPSLRHKAEDAGLAKQDVELVVEYYGNQNRLLRFGYGALTEDDEAEAARQREEFKRILLGTGG